MAIQRLIFPVQSAKIVGSTVDGANYITNPAGIDGGQNTWALLFDASTAEQATWTFQMPSNYTDSPSANIQFTMTSSSGSVDFNIDTKGLSSGNPNSTVPGFATATSFAVAVSSSVGFIQEITASLTTGTLAADRFIVLRLSRAVASSSDTASGDAEVRALTFEYST